jgi:signal transduction histidine kinase
VSEPDKPSALILDPEYQHARELGTRLEAHGFSALLAASLDEAAQLLANPRALILITWPQPCERAAIERELLPAVGEAVALLLVGALESAPAPDAPPLPRCTLHSLDSTALLARQLWEARRQLAETRAHLAAQATPALLGELIAGVAHDLNNPLTAVIGNAELLPTQPSEEDQQGVRQIIESARRAQSLAHHLLVIARSRPGQSQWIDTAALLRGTAALHSATMRSNGVQLTLELAPHMPQLWGEHGQLQQALMHLLRNALQAVQQQTVKRIELRGFPQHAHSGQCLVVEVRDSGPGLPAMPPELLFEPYVSARPGRRGAGIGLSLVREIAERSGGSVSAFSPAEGGAGFRIVLPLLVPPFFQDDLSDLPSSLRSD